MAVPLNAHTTKEQRGAVRFLWAKVMAAKKQSSKTTSFGGTIS